MDSSDYSAVRILEALCYPQKTVAASGPCGKSRLMPEQPDNHEPTEADIYFSFIMNLPGLRLHHFRPYLLTIQRSAASSPKALQRSL